MWEKKSSSQTKFCSLYFFINTLLSKNRNKYNLPKKLIKTIFILFFLLFILSYKNKNIKVALCTMGKQENLYVKEFISYYIRLGIDKILIYDDNDINTEQISDMIEDRYRKYIKIYKPKKLKLFSQCKQFTDCYAKNKDKYDWLLMIDMDEFLYIKKNSLKNYLLKPVFNKCDFIKFHWIIPNDNNHLYYENKPLLERFKGPYKSSPFVKSIIRGKIKKLKYMVHSPSISPFRNISCNNIGKKINNNKVNIELINNINIKKAFIIHFKFKSTEEYINKIKRGYHGWSKSYIYQTRIKSYFESNKITKEKIKYFEKELKINLSNYNLKRKVDKAIFLK